MIAAIVTTALGVMLASASPARQMADTTRPAARPLPQLEARIEEVLARTRTPGAAVAIVTRDSVLYTDGIGIADVASQRPATSTTLFRIGSTSKAFTALVVLMLQEEGKLRLDDPLRTHIPEIAFENPWEATDPVRIVHALEHTTGFDDWTFRELANNDPKPLTLREGLDFHAPGSRVSRWRPGTRVAYSNSGPPLAAHIVEKIEGKPFEEVVEERLFEPLGMRTATYLFPDTTKVVLARLYRLDGRAEPYWHPIQRPAGSVNASAEDMASYLRFLLNRGRVGGRQLLPAAAIERLERSEASLVARTGLPVGYGLHTARYVESGFVWTGHDGGVNGGLASIAYLPEHGVGYAFMINSSSRAAFEDIGRLVREVITKDLPRPTPPAAAPMPAGLRAQFAGWYRPDNPRARHFYFVERLLGLTRVSVADSALVVATAIGGAERYIPVSRTTFRGEREPVATLALVRDSANGRPVAIERMGYLLPTSLVRVATPLALAEIALVTLWIAGTMVTGLAALAGVVRLVWRRRAASPARVIWRMAFGTTAALFGALGLFALTAVRSPLDLGRPGAAMVGAYLLLWLFAVLGTLGALLALRPASPAPGGRSRRWSLWSARVVAVTNLIVAAYLIYWRVVGWRTWA